MCHILEVAPGHTLVVGPQASGAAERLWRPICRGRKPQDPVFSAHGEPGPRGAGPVPLKSEEASGRRLIQAATSAGKSDPRGRACPWEPKTPGAGSRRGGPGSGVHSPFLSWRCLPEGEELSSESAGSAPRTEPPPAFSEFPTGVTETHSSQANHVCEASLIIVILPKAEADAPRAQETF